ncbi:MAG: 4-carboxymuconolactone decarboxylase [Chloroflexi bacterium]|nr:MAG: 4-carboxymuconolactone decarboxylase [Chloroflexota bacterium]
MTDERFQRGMEMRRRVLGDEQVDRAEAARSELTDDFVEYFVSAAWGDVWTRPGLDLRTRSCITVAMLVALNRPAELRLHLLGALRNGVTRAELKEILLQTAVYCGVPAANDAYRVAQEVLHPEKMS